VQARGWTARRKKAREERQAVGKFWGGGHEGYQQARNEKRKHEKPKRRKIMMYKKRKKPIIKQISPKWVKTKRESHQQSVTPKPRGGVGEKTSDRRGQQSEQQCGGGKINNLNQLDNRGVRALNQMNPGVGGKVSERKKRSKNSTSSNSLTHPSRLTSIDVLNEKRGIGTAVRNKKKEKKNRDRKWTQIDVTKTGSGRVCSRYHRIWGEEGTGGRSSANHQIERKS